MNVVFVVRGVCLVSVPAVTPTRNCRAAGLDVRNDKSTSGFEVVAGVPESPSFLVELATAAVDRIARNWAMTASLRLFSSLSAWFNFLVSRSFLRWARIVSGVGSSGEEVNWRFYKRTSQPNTPETPASKCNKTNLIMLQPDVR